jgi:hypothetical protein
MKPIFLEPKMVPEHLRGSYRGRMYQAVLGDKVDIPASAGNWHDGSRETYWAVELKSGNRVPVSDQVSPPWDAGRAEREVTLQQGLVVVRHTISRGRDMGLTFFMHPVDAAPMLPAPVTLTSHEQIVLRASAWFKAAYNGKTRYEMAKEDLFSMRVKLEPGERFPSRAEWATAKTALVTKKLLTEAGAITVAGRNAERGMS